MDRSHVWKAVSGQLDFATVEAAKAHFNHFIVDPAWAVGCHFVFMALCVLIVYKGVKSGIERWSKILMPVLFFIILALIVRSLTLPGAMAGVRFYSRPTSPRSTPAAC